MNNLNKKINKFIYNRYISKSLINIHSKNKFYNTNFPYNIFIYYILDTWFQYKEEKYTKFIKNIINQYPNELEKYRKGYEYIYKNKINLRRINR